ncbi:hypothetical protein [Mucilaginibacter flavidus]|uniref:hypothetical protein n=1 Tax=Mucilaginibacter flavidus TaxID=2949309 RepID=UPI0020936178|nr:hypothetical protein [Mucilaginibacter flavidus]
MESNDGNISLIEQKIKELNLTSKTTRELLVESIDANQLVEVKGFIEINLNPMHDI